MVLIKRIPFFILGLFAADAAAEALQCPQDVKGQASQMIASIIARHQGAAASSSGTGLIELGIFYQALRAGIAATKDTNDKREWTNYLYNSTSTAIPLFTDASTAVGLPLDRFSIGTEMIRQSRETRNDRFASAIRALQDSMLQQRRNANGGLWYYANPSNFTAYQNLSYLDGMYSYSTFAILDAGNSTRNSDIFGAEAVLKQFEIFESLCDDGTGLLYHGYDAMKAHVWADPDTGASPSVWGRSLAWYTLGMLEALDILQSMPPTSMTLSTKIASSSMKNMSQRLMRSQIVALERALAIDETYGVWQVIDLPGASINGTNNFVESSASLMSAYSLLKSVRLDMISDGRLRTRAVRAGVELWKTIMRTHVTRNENGTLDLSGTSSIASLSPQVVDAKYSFARPTVDNSLLGTSAFILTGLELEKLCA